VYVWGDGVHCNVRLEDDRLCTLVMIGVRPDGTKELIAVEDGYRESPESWKNRTPRREAPGDAPAPGKGSVRPLAPPSGLAAAAPVRTREADADRAALLDGSNNPSSPSNAPLPMAGPGRVRTARLVRSRASSSAADSR
jgi:hypothetical protein